MYINEEELRIELQKLNSKLDLCLEKLNDITEPIQKMENSCTHMDTHINWVENIYTLVKAPLHFMLRKYHGISLLPYNLRIKTPKGLICSSVF